MYRLTGIRLHNICQHADLEADIRTGLTAVTGPNGSGKTSALRGLVYALTGLVDGMWGNQQTLQKDGTADVGYAEARFTDGRHEYAVRRFSTSSVKFADAVTCDGEVIVQRRQKVNEFMETVFGMPVQLMFVVCWGRQGDLAMLLKGTSSTVSSFLAQVFDTKSLEKLRERIKSQLDRIAQLPSACVLTLDRDRKALDALAPEGDLADRVTSCSSAVSALRESIGRISERTAAAMSAEAGRQELEAKLDAVERALAEYPAPDNMEESEVPPLEDIDSSLSEVTAELQKLTVDYSRARLDADDASARYNGALESLEALSRHIDEVRAGCAPEDGVCPLCGGHVQDTAAFLENLSRMRGDSLAGLESSRDELVRRVDVLRQEHDERGDALALALSARDAANAELSYFSSLRKARIHYDLRRNSAYLRDQLAGRDEALASVCADRAEADRLSGLLDAAEADERAATAALAENRAMRRMLEQAVSDGEKAVAQYETNKAAREALSELRDIFSQGRAQARYMKAQLRRLNAELARNMALTQMPFSLRLDDETRTFVFTTQDGYDHPACHLSGAQQAMSSVALQMALFAVMRPSLNLFLIDEPAEALDNDNKRILADMFARMNRMLPSVDGTMLIVTRDEPIIESCGGRIEIGN